MNSNINRTANTSIAADTNLNNTLNANSNNNTIVKEDTTMNTNTIVRRNTVSRLARLAAALVALGTMLAASHAANADIVVDKFVGAQQTYGVTPGTTAMQLKVRNTDGYTVSGAKIKTDLYRFVGFIFTHQASPSSEAFSLAPYESKWITVAIPAKSDSGTPLQGLNLMALAYVGKNGYTLSFLNVPAQALVQASNVQMTGQSNGADVFKVTFTNSYVASPAQTATVSTWLYGDGRVGSAHNQTVNIPALAAGASYTVTLTSQATQGYDIQGTVQVGTGNAINFEF